MHLALRILYGAVSLALAMAVGFVVGQFDERAAWIERGPVCVDLVLRGGRFELKSEGVMVLEYGR